MKIIEKDIADIQRENQLLKAQTEKDKANIDYLSMMTEIPIPSEEVNENELSFT